MGFNYTPKPYAIDLPVGTTLIDTLIGNEIVASFAITVLDVTGGAVTTEDRDGNVATMTKSMSMMFGGQDQRQVPVTDFSVTVPDGSEAILSWEF